MTVERRPPAFGIDFSRFDFYPVVHLEAGYEIYDFTEGYDPDRQKDSEYGVGRFNERRPATYQTELFSGDRNIHMGIDLRAPVGTAVHAFADGEIHLFGYNGAAGDYGHTLITRHKLDGVDLYALYGHLSARSTSGKAAGQPIKKGEVIAWIGEPYENGGWPHHLHFQLSVEEPTVCDMPGAVSAEEHAAALATYPDPRLVLGQLYEGDP